MAWASKRNASSSLFVADVASLAVEPSLEQPAKRLMDRNAVLSSVLVALAEWGINLLTVVHRIDKISPA